MYFHCQECPVVKSRNTKPELAHESDTSETRILSSIEIVTLGVFLLGGDAHYVETEDIAVKANELAPGKFTWVKYPDQINIHVIKTHLWDAKSARKGSLLLGSEKEGWMLSSSGLAMARNRVAGLKHLKQAKRKLSEPERRWMRADRVRMLQSEGYRKVASGDSNSVTLEEAEAFFRLNAYIVGKARDRKILRVINVFGDDPDLGPVVRLLAEKLTSR
jgi:hypothetical protein